MCVYSKAFKLINCDSKINFYTLENIYTLFFYYVLILQNEFI